MDAMTIGLAALALVLILLAMRVPIAFVLAGVASLGTFLVYATRTGGWSPDRALNPTSSVVLSNFFDLVHSYDLSMVPLFVALGNIAFYAGITTRIYDAAAVWLRTVRGAWRWPRSWVRGFFGHFGVFDRLRIDHGPHLRPGNAAHGL